jgi:energy-coupling factor transport system permease protein
MGATNPIFVHRGLTELFFIGKDPYTLEALLYGLSSGCSIASLLIWFSVFNAIVTQDDILAVFGKRLPKTALVISMILGFIPKLRQKYTELGHAQHASGATRRKNLHRSAALFIACLAYEAERVMDISMSMKARGYGLKNRTHAQKRRFRKSDGAAIGFSLVLCILCFVFIGKGRLDYWYYPRLSPNGFDPLGAGSYLLLCISPLFFIVKEKTLWRYCPAKN